MGANFLVKRGSMYINIKGNNIKIKKIKNPWVLIRSTVPKFYECQAPMANASPDLLFSPLYYSMDLIM